MIISILQVLYDLCLCWLLGTCSSSSCPFKRFLVNSSAWKNEAGIAIEIRYLWFLLKPTTLLWMTHLNVKFDSLQFLYHEDFKGESPSFFYISIQWHSSMYGCCSTWTWHSRGWLYRAGSLITTFLHFQIYVFKYYCYKMCKGTVLDLAFSLQIMS